MDKYIGCVGLNCVDTVIDCEDFPIEDHDQIVKSFDRRRGGNASNNCSVLSLLGVQVEYLGSISDTDSDGKFLSDSFSSQGIKIQNCQFIPEYKTLNVAVICNTKNHSRTILRPESITYPEYSFSKFKTLNFDSFKWLHFEGRRNTNEIKEMIELLSGSHHNIGISLEIEKTRSTELLDLLSMVDVGFVSKDMASHLGYSHMKEAVLGLMTKLKTNAILICPWGDKGAAGIVNRCDTPTAIVSPACPLPDNCHGDSLGAGDTFIAGVVALMSEVMRRKPTVCENERALQLVLDWGNYLAGLKCENVGFDCVSQCREQFEKYVENILNCK